MCKVPKEVFDASLTVLGGVLAGFVGVFVSSRQRCREARLQFLTFVSIQKGAVPEDCLGFYQSTLEQVRNEIFRVLPFLSKRKAKKMLAAWNHYRTINQGYLGRERYTESYRQEHAKNENWPSAPPAEELQSCFEQMYELAD